MGTKDSGKKYRIDINDTILHDGRMLYRVIALKDFGNVQEGDKGGYIENVGNLSQTGLCWVGARARVWGKASVKEDALVLGRAKVGDGATVCGSAKLTDWVCVSGDVVIDGTKSLSGNDSIKGDN